MNINRNLLVVLGTACAYGLLFELNRVLFSSFAFSSSVDWIFLPSGLRLAFILVFVQWGAVGVAIASALLTYFFQTDESIVNALLTGAISGLGPLLARQVCIDLLKLDAHLRDLNTATLIKTAAVFALFSSLLHQVWYTWIGQTSRFIDATIAMATGDFLGTVIVLYAAKFVLTNILPSVAIDAEEADLH